MAQITVISVSLIILASVERIVYRTPDVYCIHIIWAVWCYLELEWILFWETLNRISSAETYAI